MLINNLFIGDEFPSVLASHGLTKEILLNTLSGLSVWQWQSTPTIGTYRALHKYLGQSGITKTEIGRLYCLIDSHFKVRDKRPCNVYRYVNNIIVSKRPSECQMVYVWEDTSLGAQLRECSKTVQEVKAEYTELKKKFETTRNKLKQTRHALRDVTNDNTRLNVKWERAKGRITNLKQSNAILRDECTEVEVDSESSEAASDISDNHDSLKQLQEIVGHKKYSPEIRALYYKLLADQVPVNKVADIIKAVLTCFNPSVEVGKLNLPKKSCASYMRKEELRTICDAQKASMISQSKQLYLNTDGTTKFQRKLGGVVANGLVLSVNEVADGSARTAVDDISSELEKLRKAANALGLPNANSINWTLVVSSSADSAATQKCMNKLIEELREADEEKFASTYGRLFLMA